MKIEDIIVIAILVVVVGLASLYIYKAKKSGKKCIGCPDGGCSCCKSHEEDEHEHEHKHEDDGCGCGCGCGCSHDSAK